MDKFFDTASIQDSYDIVVIGAGPAGCTAGMYTSRDELSTLILERAFPGGQMGTTSHIDNHPGTPETATGMDMAQKYFEQAIRFGATLRQGKLVDIVMKDDLSKDLYIEGREKSVNAKAVIIATGCVPKTLNIPGERKFWGRGVSTCATCDGGFYKDKIIVAVGGGNTALNESLYLTRFAKKIYLVHRRDEFRGAKISQRTVENHPQIELVLDSTVTEIKGESVVEAVTVKNLKSGEEREIKTDGLFIFIGQSPSVEPFDKYIKTDEAKFLITGEYMDTELSGVYAAGDVRSKKYRQIAIAAGEGVIAAQQALHYLQAQGK